MSKRRVNKRQGAKHLGYHSRFEWEIAQALLELEIPFEYELHSFQWLENIPNTTCRDCGSDNTCADRTYTPDFFLFDPNKPLIIEAKGIFTVKDRKIAQAMKVQHPDVKIHYLFYFDNKLNKSSKTRYTTWCKKQGLPSGTRANMKKVLKEWQESYQQS